ncbi:hypothetical protein B1812_06515 [Methylocystis bryophila]|uniref:DUF2946 domain-containing protein n=2 Tax=Methylocystis bryophila TaxID=655015 RepID=A0A1W6MT33_9HYPH|nr:hypothetical protein B1812_06515 [Methylocystis bryophila]
MGGTKGMRRNAIAVVLFALALGLKVLLPAATPGHAATVPGQGTVLQYCISAVTYGAGGQQHAPGKGGHVAACPICQLSCEGSFASLERAPLQAPVALHDRVELFGRADGAEPPRPLASAHQPRAPPSC